MLHVETWPQLRDPVLLVTLSGWVDAGLAGAMTAGWVVGHLEAARPFGYLDVADRIDLGHTRPTVVLTDGVVREIRWPRIDLVAGRGGTDVVVMSGPEPSLRWRELTAATVTLARRLGVRLGVMLGGMPVAVSHRREVGVLATATDPGTAARLGSLRLDYTGPTGAQTVVQAALGAAGIPAVGLWAQVPHYVSATPSPPAILALLRRLREVAGVVVDTEGLEREAAAYLDKIEAGLASRPDVAELVRRLEGMLGPTDLPSGDELAREIERFLRDEPPAGGAR